MASSYPNTGALFINNRDDNPKAPQWKGDIELDADLLRILVEKAKARQPIKLALAGWEKESPKAGRFISLRADKPYEKPAAAPAPASSPVGSYDDDEIPF